MAADKRSEVDNVSKVRSSISNEIPDNEEDEPYDKDDLALTQSYFGQNRKLI
jgi:hypothetical protein